MLSDSLLLLILVRIFYSSSRTFLRSKYGKSIKTVFFTDSDGVADHILPVCSNVDGDKCTKSEIYVHSRVTNTVYHNIC